MKNTAVIIGENRVITLPNWVIEDLKITPGDDITFRKDGNEILIEKC